MQLVEIPFMGLSLAVLFLGGLGIYLAKGRLGHGCGVVASTVSLIATFLMVPPFFRVMVERGTAYEGLRWSTILGEFGLRLDGISFPVTLAVVVLGLTSVTYAVGYTEHAENRPTFFANHLFFLMGMQWVTLATNLVEFFIAWEIMLVPTYFLILFWGVPETRTRTAIKFWLYTQAGAVTILIGFGMIAYLVSVQTGTLTLDMQVIQTVVPALTGSLTTLKVIYVLLAAGFLVKMAVFPLHWWLPPVHAEAPTPISVLLSGAMIETGAYAMVRFNTIILSSVAIDLSFWVAMLGVLTMFYGGIMALAQRDIKRLLAYSSVSQMGYVLFAIGVFTVSGVTGGLFHLVSHALSKGLLFMCAGAVIHQTQLRDIGAMGGLSNKMPVTAFAAAVGAMSIAGSPPLAGFASEWLMFLGGFHAYESTGNTPFLVLSVVAISSIILSASYMLRFFTTVFLGPHPEDLEEVHEAPRSMTLSMTVLAVLTLIFGVFPALAVDVIKPLVEIISGILPWR